MLVCACACARACVCVRVHVCVCVCVCARVNSQHSSGHSNPHLDHLEQGCLGVGVLQEGGQDHVEQDKLQLDLTEGTNGAERKHHTYVDAQNTQNHIHPSHPHVASQINGQRTSGSGSKVNYREFPPNYSCLLPSLLLH